MRPKQIGFTLIEILISMVILGIIVSFVVISYGDIGATRRLAMEQQHFADLIQLARNRAIISGQIYGININKSGYRFYTFQQGTQNNHWQPSTDPLFKPTSYPSHKKFSYNHSISSPTPEVVISSDGHITPFTLSLSSYTDETITIQAHQNGEIDVSDSEGR